MAFSTPLCEIEKLIYREESFLNILHPQQLFNIILEPFVVNHLKLSIFKGIHDNYE